MAIVDIEMPKMGESIVEATILNWLKNPGDTVEIDEPILEIATDKVDSEVPSTVAGVLSEVLFQVNDVVPIGTVIARIDTEGSVAATPSPSTTEASPAENTVPEPIPVPTQTPSPAPAQTYEQSASTAASTASVEGTTGGDRFYSPLVMKIASKEGIGMAELEQVPGSGKNGRVSKKDILNYVKNRGANSVPSIAETPQRESSSSAHAASVVYGSAGSAAVTGPTGTSAIIDNSATGNVPSENKTQPTTSVASSSDNVEVVPMDRMRKLIADHMVNSKATSPHVTSFAEADVTNLVNWRNRVKSEYQKKYGEKITFTPIFIEAVAKCIQDYPMINSSVDGENILVKKDINIGMATALPSGNLIVPVIKNADRKNIVGLTSDVNDLALRAREGKLKPEDTQGGTFTMTNVGTFGSLMGTPIINQPQVAILAVGTIVKRPMVLETSEGDVIGIRQMMYLSLSYDHRIVDGSLGASFLTAVAKQLEAFDTNRSI